MKQDVDCQIANSPAHGIQRRTENGQPALSHFRQVRESLGPSHKLCTEEAISGPNPATSSGLRIFTGGCRVKTLPSWLRKGLGHTPL